MEERTTRCEYCLRPESTEKDIERMEEGELSEKDQDSICFMNDYDCVDEVCTTIYASRLEKRLVAADEVLSIVLPRCEHEGCTKFATIGLNGLSCDDHKDDTLQYVPPERIKQYEFQYIETLRRYIDLTDGTDNNT